MIIYTPFPFCLLPATPTSLLHHSHPALFIHLQCLIACASKTVYPSYDNNVCSLSYFMPATRVRDSKQLTRSWSVRSRNRPLGGQRRKHKGIKRHVVTLDDPKCVPMGRLKANSAGHVPHGRDENDPSSRRSIKETKHHQQIVVVANNPKPKSQCH